MSGRKKRPGGYASRPLPVISARTSRWNGNDVRLRPLADIVEVERGAGAHRGEAGFDPVELLGDAEDAVPVFRIVVFDAADARLAGERAGHEGAEDRSLATVGGRVEILDTAHGREVVEVAELEFLPAAQLAAGGKALLELVEDEELDGDVE